MAIAQFTVTRKSTNAFSVQHYGNATFAGRKSLWVCGLKLNPGDIYFHFNEDWLIPSSPYFKIETSHLKAIHQLPRYMQNGYLWLARNQNTIPGRMNPPFLRTFLKSAFKWTDKEIEAEKKHGLAKKKIKLFGEEMKEKGVLVDFKILGRTGPSNFSSNKVKFVLTKKFEDLKVDRLALTPEREQEIYRWLHLMRTCKTTAKKVMKEHGFSSKSKEIIEHIKSGTFDKLVERGYYRSFEKDLQRKSS